MKNRKKQEEIVNDEFNEDFLLERYTQGVVVVAF